MIQYALTDPKGKPPARGTPTSAGIDIFMPESVELLPREKGTVDLGVASQLPPDVCGLLVLRSWAAQAHNLRIHFGLIGKLTTCM